ncbi:MAG: hypothetical protein LUG66_03945 [Clostridiales bacterium]|nr:hypothetical protein [Clostridiales bacterium]
MNEDKKTKQVMIICIAVVIAAVIIAAGAVFYNKTKPANSETASEEPVSSTETGIEEIGDEEPDENEAAEDENEPQEQKQVTKYYGGLYYITGSDTPDEGELTEGEYVLQPDSLEGYFELVSDLSTDPSAVITSGTYNVRTYVTVSEGQYLKFDGVAIPIEEAEAYIPKNGYYDPQAMYKVGFDIQPGEYAVRMEYVDEGEEAPEGKITLLSSSSGTEGSLISEEEIEENTKVNIEDCAYVKIQGVTLSEPIN